MAEEQKATKVAVAKRYYIVSERNDPAAAALVAANAPYQALARAAAFYCNVRPATVAEAIDLIRQGANLIDPGADQVELPVEELPPGPTPPAPEMITWKCTRCGYKIEGPPTPEGKMLHGIKADGTPCMGTMLPADRDEYLAGIAAQAGDAAADEPA